MNTSRLVHLLENRDIRPTANRLLILHTMLESKRALSQRELEDALNTLDKSSISRSIHLFIEHKLIHSIDDGGAIKYAVCEEECNCEIYQQHTHFSCTVCGGVFCFEHIGVPVVSLPPGFSIESINYVIKGVCDKCRKKG